MKWVIFILLCTLGSISVAMLKKYGLSPHEYYIIGFFFGGIGQVVLNKVK